MGKVERMNGAIKDATVKRYFYETHDQLRTHLRDFVDAYNFARRLKTLRGLTPRIRLQSLDFRASEIQTQSAPPNAGTAHLANCGPRRSSVPLSVDADAAHAIGWPHDSRAVVAIADRAAHADCAMWSGASGPINATSANDSIGF
jgi:Integrase core domain